MQKNVPCCARGGGYFYVFILMGFFFKYCIGLELMSIFIMD